MNIIPTAEELMSKRLRKHKVKSNKIRRGSVVYIGPNRNTKITVDGFAIYDNQGQIYIRYDGREIGYNALNCSRTPGGPLLTLKELDLSDKYIINRYV